MRRMLAFLFIVATVAGAAEKESLNAQQQQGKVLFEATCVYCHNPRGFGTERLKTRLPEDRSVLTERRDLDPAYIRTVVRNGLASMPAYTPTDLDEAQIKAIAAYLTRRRETDSD
jgi:mono/diheme cytochrome c family protein